MSGCFHRARFMRDHRFSPRHMSAYLDGELGPSKQRRMERHTGECRECRRLLAGLQQLLGALSRLPPPAGGADAAQIVASVRVRLRQPPAF